MWRKLLVLIKQHSDSSGKLLAGQKILRLYVPPLPYLFTYAHWLPGSYVMCEVCPPRYCAYVSQFRVVQLKQTQLNG
jgi:hypothetical protein